MPVSTLVLAAFLQLPASLPPLPTLLLERRLAAELSVGIGDTVTARSIEEAGRDGSFVVAGIHERPADPNRIARNEFEAIFHLSDLERVLGLDDQVDRFAITLRPGADPRQTGDWVEGLAFGTQAMATEELANQASTTFEVVSRFHDAIGLITMLASSIFLLCLMIIRVDERRAVVRTMGLIGISRRTIFLAVVLEAVAISLVAAAVGAGLGMAIAAAVNAYYGRFYETTLRFATVTPSIVWTAVAIGVGLGIAAGTLAALRIVRLSPQRLGER